MEWCALRCKMTVFLLRMGPIVGPHSGDDPRANANIIYHFISLSLSLFDFLLSLILSFALPSPFPFLSFPSLVRLLPLLLLPKLPASHDNYHHYWDDVTWSVVGAQK